MRQVGRKQRKMDDRKRMSLPFIVTLPPLKSHTTGVTSESLWVSVIEDYTCTRILRKWAVCNDMSRVVTKGTLPVCAIVREVAEVLAERTVVLKAAVLGMSGGMLSAVGEFIVGTADINMPQGVAVKTNSLWSCHHWWAHTGVLRDNLSGIGGSVVLMKGRVRISGFVNEDKGGG